MPATIIITVVPGHLEAGRGYTSKVVEILGWELGSDRKLIRTVADARAEIAAFGERVRNAYPDASFAILVSVARGDRKPRGFDAAHRNGELGEDAFLLLREREAA
jgi:hypothetical protein